MWIRDRDAFLDELHWRHGRGCNIKTDSCDACLQSDSLTSPSTQTVRCIDCTFSPMLCSHLMVQAHKSLPLHRIEVSKPFTSVKCRLSPFTDLERRLFCIDESERTWSDCTAWSQWRSLPRACKKFYITHGHPR